MKRFLIGFSCAVILLVVFQIIINKKQTQETIIANSALIQTQIENVSKLIVTEGHFAEVISYKESKKYFMDIFSFEKDILVVVNADVTVGYDLSKITYELDEQNKTVIIKSIPEVEIKVYPDLQYFDISRSEMNPFKAEDVSKIRKKVDEQLRKKIEATTLKTNAKNRLISELSNILILTKSLGWTLEYNDTPIESVTDWNLKG